MQTDHYGSKFKKRIFPITLVCDNINKAANIGSLFRIADAFGVEKILFCGTGIPIGRRMTKTSRATEKIVPYEIHDSALSTIENLKTKGYHILSLEITSESTPIHFHNFSNQPTAIVIGDENHGISASILEQSNSIVHITMFGRNSSMNVVQATSIALYEITKQLDH